MERTVQRNGFCGNGEDESSADFADLANRRRKWKQASIVVELLQAVLRDVAKKPSTLAT